MSCDDVINLSSKYDGASEFPSMFLSNKEGDKAQSKVLPFPVYDFHYVWQTHFEFGLNYYVRNEKIIGTKYFFMVSL